MKQDRRRRLIPQSVLPSSEEIEKSPTWQSVRRTQEALRDMGERGLFPKISPEMTENLQQMREALEQSEVVREARERREREIDEEQREYEAELRRIEEARTRPPETKQPNRPAHRAPRALPLWSEAMDYVTSERQKKPALEGSMKEAHLVKDWFRVHGIEIINEDEKAKKAKSANPHPVIVLSLKQLQRRIRGWFEPAKT
jgi:hypothetical protein